MRRKSLTLLLGIALCLGFIMFLCWPSDPPPGPVSRAGLSKIRLGMSEAEVVAELGVPPGVHTTGPAQAVNPPLLHLDSDPRKTKPARKERVWLDDWTGVHVDFDEDGKVVRAFAWSQERPRGSLYYMLHWLGSFGRGLPRGAAPGASARPLSPTLSAPGFWTSA